MTSPFVIKEHILPASHIREYPHGTSQSQDNIFKLSVKQYTPKDNPDPQKGDVTIIGAHANGFPKELYEPLWAELYKLLKSKAIRIRDIYISDVAWQGQSGVLNASQLGNDPSWLDYARDILHLINLLRPPPPLLAIGHSFGACALVNVSRLHPRLFTSLVLLDPVIDTFTPGESNPQTGTTRASARRRDVWPSRDEARRKFQEHPFYQSWDSRVLDLWLQYGLRPLEPSSSPSSIESEIEEGEEGNAAGEGQVTLVTTKHQEFFTFLRPSYPGLDAAGETIVHPHLVPDLGPIPSDKSPLAFPYYRPEPASTQLYLPHLRPPVFYVFGEDSPICPPHGRKNKMESTGVGTGGSGGVKAGAVAQCVLEGKGHLVPLQDPEGCAVAMAPWVQSVTEKWRVEHKEYQKWTRKSLREKTEVSEEMKRMLEPAETRRNKDRRNGKL